MCKSPTLGCRTADLNACGGVSRPVLIILAVSVLAAVALWFGLRKTGEERVRARFSELLEVLDEPPASGLMGRARVVADFRDLFADPVVIEARQAPVNGTFTPDQLAGLYLSAVESGVRVEVEMDVGGVEFPEEGVAVADVEVRGEVIRPGGQRRARKGKARVELRLLEGEWQFAFFQSIQR